MLLNLNAHMKFMFSGIVPSPALSEERVYQHCKSQIDFYTSVFYFPKVCNLNLIYSNTFIFSGKVHKMRNHKEGNDFGFVDVILIAPSNYLFCSGYNLDFGNGYLNSKLEFCWYKCSTGFIVC